MLELSRGTAVCRQPTSGHRWCICRLTRTRPRAVAFQSALSLVPTGWLGNHAERSGVRSGAETSDFVPAHSGTGGCAIGCKTVPDMDQSHGLCPCTSSASPQGLQGSNSRHSTAIECLGREDKRFRSLAGGCAFAGSPSRVPGGVPVSAWNTGMRFVAGRKAIGKSRIFDGPAIWKEISNHRIPARCGDSGEVIGRGTAAGVGARDPETCRPR